ncbi:MAG TPA: DUF3786 domain-containing protein [Syntrophobacteria bacterium]|nr:DUF3786 domain-containing protein [Syntrophobacteria bacterium]
MARLDDFREAFRLAAEKLASINLNRACSLSGSTLVNKADGSAGIGLSFIHEELLILTRPEVDVVRCQTHEPLPLAEKIIVLHYLLTARGESLSNNFVTFREVPGGAFYYPAFLKRARDPLVRVFGGDPERLLRCGRQLGAEPANLGDASARLVPLPRIPLTLVLWKGDEEFAPEATILFDRSVGSYLPPEDIAMLSGMVVYRLIRINQSLG